METKDENKVQSTGSIERNKDNGLSTSWAAVFVVANIAGSGVLPMPHAVVEAGWIGLVLIVAACLSAGYLGTSLAKCWLILEERKPEYRKGSRSPYSDIGYEAFGKKGRIFVSIVNNIGLFGVSIVFLILCSENLNSILERYIVNYGLDQCLFQLIIAAALLPLTWLGSPKEFWWAGLLALLTTLIAVLMIIIQASLDAPIMHDDVYFPPPTFQSFFLAFGSITFAFGGASTFPTIQNDMTDKTQFVKSVNIAFVGLLLIFFPVAALGYFVYGGNVDPNILLSLSDGIPKDIGQVLISIHVFFAFLLVSSPIYLESETFFKIPNKFGWKRCLLRSIIFLFGLFIAQSVPNFGKILDLVGGSTVSLMTFILPPIFYMKLADMKGPTWQPIRIPLHERVFLWEMAILGIFCGVVASYSAIVAIISDSSMGKPCYLS